MSLLAKPDGFFSGIVFFERRDDLLAFVDEARDYSLASRECRQAADTPTMDASLVEYFDSNSLKFISEKFPETPDVAGAIFFEQETTAETEDALLEQWNALLEKHNADLENSWFATNAPGSRKNEVV